MDPLTELLNQQRGLTPPPGVTDQLEQRVMNRIERLPGERRRKRMIVGGASLCCALTLLVMLMAIPPRLDRRTPPDFVASVVILDDHVCIWLETAEVHPPNRSSHE